MEISNQIASLTLEQAQRALLLFYDELPVELWDGNEKPSRLELEEWADQSIEMAPSELQELLEKLRAEDDNEYKGEVAKALLQIFSQVTTLKPFVEQAVSQAVEPIMAPVPIIIGALIVVVLALPRIKIFKEKSGAMEKSIVEVDFPNLEKVKDILETLKLNKMISNLMSNLKELVKILPPKLLEALPDLLKTKI